MAMTKLKLYNNALMRHLGEGTLSSLSDEVESRRALDEVYDSGGIDYLLEQGLWNFAMRASKFEYTPSVTPAFGYNYAFEKPTDIIRLVSMCSDEHFEVPLLSYLDEVGYWFSDMNYIYVKYVSNDAEYGTDFSNWPETFSRFAEAWFASQVCERLTHSTTRIERLLGGRYDKIGLVRRLLIDARSKDAMKDPTRFLPAGRFVSSRTAGSSSGDRGTRGRLIG